MFEFGGVRAVDGVEDMPEILRDAGFDIDDGFIEFDLAFGGGDEGAVP
ncbi:MAG: hypothetical protein ISN28_08780 [Ectothiorhodospiraceae bacterium AqS1]|nr:hypothetical protein [Ectothiorhodospiraceae bacterium AqS1]